MPDVSRRTLFGLLAGAAAAPLVKASEPVRYALIADAAPVTPLTWWVARDGRLHFWPPSPVADLVSERWLKAREDFISRAASTVFGQTLGGPGLLEGVDAS